MKYCRGCEQWKRLVEFPLDRSRRDGRWHTCKLCNRQRGRLLRQAAKERKRLALLTAPPPPPAPRWRLEGLKEYRGKEGQPPAGLSAAERFIAQQLFNKYLWQRRGMRLSQPKRALLAACARSNAKRVGDNSWSRRMKRLKGWRRQRQREFEQQIQMAEMRARKAARPQVGYTGAGYTAADRLAGI